MSPLVMDAALVLQVGGGVADGFAADAEQHPERLLGERQIGAGPSLRHLEQQSRQPPLHGVMRAADRFRRDLDDEFLGVPQ